MDKKVADLISGDGEKSSPSSSSSTDTSISFDDSIPSRQERLYMYIETLSDDAKADCGTPEELLNYASYVLDMIEYFGFDLTHPSNDLDIFPMIVPFHNPPTDEAPPDYVDMFRDCSSKAIAVYNKIHGTHFGNKVRVIKANSQVGDGYDFYITFEATDEKENMIETFQAMVNVPFLMMEPNVKFEPNVDFVRVKPPFIPYPHTPTTFRQEVEDFRTRWDEAIKN